MLYRSVKFFLVAVAGATADFSGKTEPVVLEQLENAAALAAGAKDEESAGAFLEASGRASPAQWGGGTADATFQAAKDTGEYYFKNDPEPDKTIEMFGYRTGNVPEPDLHRKRTKYIFSKHWQPNLHLVGYLYSNSQPVVKQVIAPAAAPARPVQPILQQRAPLRPAHGQQPPAGIWHEAPVGGKKHFYPRKAEAAHRGRVAIPIPPTVQPPPSPPPVDSVQPRLNLAREGMRLNMARAGTYRMQIIMSQFSW
ncbi:unnamed protein product [Amoebophrya sp. A120]|nr:unnamed protein product [Amoebophrya sp. A120]|eukprot:GSA120T00006993001.1